MGHAIVGHMSPLCDPVERVTVIPQGQALGVTVALPTEDRFLATRQECVERLAMMMAGRAAEELVFGEFTSGAADDLNRAAALARRMVGELGMGAPTISSRCLTCSMRVTPDVYQELVTFGVDVVLPIHENFRASNLTPDTPTACLFIMLAMMRWIAVPSCGATFASQLAALMPPAPGMLRGMIVGLPGR